MLEYYICIFYGFILFSFIRYAECVCVCGMHIDWFRVGIEWKEIDVNGLCVCVRAVSEGVRSEMGGKQYHLNHFSLSLRSGLLMKFHSSCYYYFSNMVICKCISCAHADFYYHLTPTKLTFMRKNNGRRNYNACILKSLYFIQICVHLFSISKQSKIPSTE